MPTPHTADERLHAALFDTENHTAKVMNDFRAYTIVNQEQAIEKIVAYRTEKLADTAAHMLADIEQLIGKAMSQPNPPIRNAQMAEFRKLIRAYFGQGGE